MALGKQAQALDLADEEEGAGDDDGLLADVPAERLGRGADLAGQGRPLLRHLGQNDGLRLREEDPRHRPDVLVLHGGEDQDDLPADDSADVVGQRADTLFIMGAVEKDDGAPRNGLQPPLPAGLADAAEHQGPFEGPPRPGQDLGSGDGYGRVVPLVAPGETGAEPVGRVTRSIREPETAVRPLARQGATPPERLDEWSPSLLGPTPDLFKGLA